MMKIYPVPRGEQISNDFQMSVNGVSLPLHYARVSAYPINCRWPGHQRPLYQTELASFASFAMTEPVQVKLKPAKPFRQVVVRPLSRDVRPAVRDGVIEFTLPASGQYTVELDGPHNALHIFADEVKEYAVDRNDPKVRYYGPGLHDVGVIELHKDETLFIDEGAVVFARVVAHDADNVRILGRGILDGSRNREVYLHEFNEEDRKLRDKGFAVQNVKRQGTVRLTRCDHCIIDGITLRDSLVYTIHPICCDHLQICNVKIIGNWRYNSDGIDMHNCRDVEISGCFLRTFDDAICVKGFDYELDPKEMLCRGEVRNRFCRTNVSKCVVWCDWGRALEFGAETRAEEICDVTFRDCDVIHNFDTACDVTTVDYADIHDILFENIRVEENPTQQRIMQTQENQPFADAPNPPPAGCVIRCISQRHPEYSGNDPRVSVFRNITFRNISVTGRMLGCYFHGADKDHVSGPVRIENLRCNGKHLTTPEELRLLVEPFVKDVTII